MSLTEDLRQIAPRHAEIAQRKQDAVKAFHTELAPFVEHARAAIPKIDRFIAREVAPVIQQCRGFKIADSEINRWLFELSEGIVKKSAELQMYIDACQKLGWDDIRQTVYPDLVDESKREALVRLYRQKLRFFGDVEGAARSLIVRINQRAAFLAENCGRADLEELPLSKPSEGGGTLKAIHNLPHD